MSAHQLIHVGETTSTNDIVARWIRTGCDDGRAVWADAQTHGRGRLGRPWFSPTGENLYMSIAVVGADYQPVATQIPLAAAVGVAEAIAEIARVEPGLKWPNDVLIDGRKLAGILCEAVSDRSGMLGVAVGVGINANTPRGAFPTDIEQNATSLQASLGSSIEIATLADAVRREVVAECRRLASAGPAPTLARWGRRDQTTGRRVCWDDDGTEMTGLAESIELDGELRVRSDDGRSTLLRSGEVRFC